MSNLVSGVIEAKLPRDLYRVRTSDGKTVVASASSEARRVVVKLIPGDQVTIEVSPFDPTRGRIKV
ncbi:MAG: translation initiation factor IF-1 [Polyangiales bacterium]|nr:translation initiation factor IF-1 [Myxococcales bacterium]